MMLRRGRMPMSTFDPFPAAKVLSFLSLIPEQRWLSKRVTALPVGCWSMLKARRQHEDGLPPDSSRSRQVSSSLTLRQAPRKLASTEPTRRPYLLARLIWVKCQSTSYPSVHCQMVFHRVL